MIFSILVFYSFECSAQIKFFFFLSFSLIHYYLWYAAFVQRKSGFICFLNSCWLTYSIFLVWSERNFFSCLRLSEIIWNFIKNIHSWCENRYTRLYFYCSQLVWTLNLILLSCSLMSVWHWLQNSLFFVVVVVCDLSLVLLFLIYFVYSY